jgi:hypothetical protein
LNYPEELLQHAWMLVARAWKDEPSHPRAFDDEVVAANLRRAVSAAYYALFHQITMDAVGLIAPNVPASTNHRIQRWFNHTEMKAICVRFVPEKLERPLRDLIGESASPDLQTVARNFIQLQNARHRADYDLSYDLTWDDAYELLELASEGVKAWQHIQGSAEANIFILSQLMWKNWERER